MEDPGQPFMDGPADPGAMAATQVVGGSGLPGLSAKDFGRPSSFDGEDEAWPEWSFMAKAFFVMTGLIDPVGLEELSVRTTKVFLENLSLDVQK